MAQNIAVSLLKVVSKYLFLSITVIALDSGSPGRPGCFRERRQVKGKAPKQLAHKPGTPLNDRSQQVQHRIDLRPLLRAQQRVDSLHPAAKDSARQAVCCTAQAVFWVARLVAGTGSEQLGCGKQKGADYFVVLHLQLVEVNTHVFTKASTPGSAAYLEALYGLQHNRYFGGFAVLLPLGRTSCWESQMACSSASAGDFATSNWTASLLS